VRVRREAESAPKSSCAGEQQRPTTARTLAHGAWGGRNISTVHHLSLEWDGREVAWWGRCTVHPTLSLPDYSARTG
jgi:hypothetical protein